MILDVGRDELVRLLGDGLGGASWSHFAAGTDPAAPASGQTGVITEVARVASANGLTTTTIANDTARLSGSIEFSAGHAIIEWGFVNAATGGVFLNRDIEDEALDVKNGDILFVEQSFHVTALAGTHALPSGSTQGHASTNAIVPIVAGRLAGTDTTTRIKALALGQGTTAPAISQTALVDEVTNVDGWSLHREAAVTNVVSLVSTGILRVETKWTSHVNTPANTPINEVAPFTDLVTSGGTMAARATLATTHKYWKNCTTTYRFDFKVVV